MIDFVIDLSISTNWKSKSYILILFIIDQLIKVAHYEPVKIIIDASNLVKVIVNMIVWYYSFSNLIINNRSFVFKLKFWLPLCYFLGINQKISTTFHLQINSQTKRENSIIQAYFQAFINFEKNYWAKFWLITKLLIIIQKTQASVILFLNSTTTTTLVFFMRKTLIYTLNPNL